MKSEEVKELFEKNKALLTGHFLLSSGLHSDTYFQSAIVLQYPEIAEKLGKAIAQKAIKAVSKINVVVSPALGGLIIGQEVARALGCRAIFVEKVDGKLTMRRGFAVEPNEKCLVVEDVITTGLSTNEVIRVLKSMNADVVAVASLVDRSGGKADFSAPKISLLDLDIKSYKSEECPLCKEGLKIVKPGSRDIKK
ncbi:orotate phosphoribosyltransferase [Elusimicrobiota bacterium]